MSQPKLDSRSAGLQFSGEPTSRSRSKWPLILAIAVYTVFFVFLLVTAISVGL